MTKGEDEHYPNGNWWAGALVLERWVLDAALARDPGLKERLAGWRWEQAERACGEAW